MATATPPVKERDPDTRIGSYEFRPLVEGEQFGSDAALDPVNYIMYDGGEYGSLEYHDTPLHGFRRCIPGDILRPTGGGLMEIVVDERDEYVEGQPPPPDGWRNPSGLRFRAPQPIRLASPPAGPTGEMHPMITRTVVVNGAEIEVQEPDYSRTVTCNVYQYSMNCDGEIYLGPRLGWKNPKEVHDAMDRGYAPNPTEMAAYNMLYDLYEQGCTEPGYTRILPGPNGGQVARTWDLAGFERAVVWGDRIKYHPPVDGMPANAFSKKVSGVGGDWSPSDPEDRDFSYNVREAHFKDPDDEDDHRSNTVRKPVDGELVLAKKPIGLPYFETVSGNLTTRKTEARPLPGGKRARYFWRASGNRDGSGDALLVDPVTENYRERIVGSTILNGILNYGTLGVVPLWTYLVGWLTRSNTVDENGVPRDPGAPIDSGKKGLTTLEWIGWNVALQFNRERRTKDLHEGTGKENTSLQQKEIRYAGNAVSASFTDMGVGGLKMLLGGVIIAAGVGSGVGLVAIAGVSVTSIVAATAMSLAGVIAPQFMAQFMNTREDREHGTEWHERANKLAGMSYRDADGKEMKPKFSVVGILLKNPLQYFMDSGAQLAKGVAGSLYAMGGGERGKIMQVGGTALLVGIGALAFGTIGWPALIPAAITTVLTAVNLTAGRGSFEDYYNRNWKGKVKTKELRIEESKWKLGRVPEP